MVNSPRLASPVVPTRQLPTMNSFSALSVVIRWNPAASVAVLRLSEHITAADWLAPQYTTVTLRPSPRWPAIPHDSAPTPRPPPAARRRRAGRHGNGRSQRRQFYNTLAENFA